MCLHYVTTCKHYKEHKAKPLDDVIGGILSLQNVKYIKI